VLILKKINIQTAKIRGPLIELEDSVVFKNYYSEPLILNKRVPTSGPEVQEMTQRNTEAVSTRYFWRESNDILKKFLKVS
jgi:hypothetical protein